MNSLIKSCRTRQTRKKSSPRRKPGSKVRRNLLETLDSGLRRNDVKIGFWGFLRIHRTTLLLAVGPAMTIAGVLAVTLALCLSAGECLAGSANPSYIHQFEEQATGAEIDHVFDITNNGDEPLSIKQVTSSCASLRILSFTSTVQPSEKGRVRIRFTAAAPGEVACSIDLDTDSRDEPERHFQLKGKITGNMALANEDIGLNFPPEFTTRKLRQVSSDKRKTVADVVKAIADKESIALVDVREASDFEKLRIQGSMNIPLYLIKTKPFLKNQTVVLVNEGYAYTQLEIERTRLGELGFAKVFILEGGLNAGSKSQDTLAGDPFEIEKTADVSPKVFFLERHWDNWTFIDASAPDFKEGEHLIPEAIRVPFSGDEDDFIKRLHDTLDGSQDKAGSSVLFFDQNGERYAALKHLVRKSGLKKVFFLEGGLEGYKSFLNNQALMRQPLKIKSGVEACKSCP